MSDQPVGLVVARLIIATAIGEEILFRGVLLALFLAARQPPGRAAAANLVFFAAWHVAGATKGGTLHPLEIAGPAAGALMFLWARGRYGSIAAPALLHVMTNLPAWVIVHCR